MTKDRLFHKEYAPELLRIAENDLLAARTLATNPEVRRESVFFMVQQSVEKSLKALLCHYGKSIPMIHDIELLADRLGNLAPREAAELADLSDFAAVRRYEEGKFILTDEEFTEAVAAADRVVRHCRKAIGK